MDAAQKLLKTSALVFVVALLMAVPGWAQPQLVPDSTSVTIPNTGSAFTGLHSSVPGSEITYTIAKSYADNSSGDWLVVTPSGTTTPATLTFSLLNFRPPAPGAGATVTLHPTSPAGVADVSISVTFNGSSSGGGGGSSTLTPSQTSVTLPGNGSVVISTTSTSSIGLSASVQQSSCGNVNWLGFQLPVTTVSSAQTSTLTVTASSIGLTSGQVCQGNIIVTPTTGTVLTIPVNFTAGGSSSGTGR